MFHYLLRRRLCNEDLLVLEIEVIHKFLDVTRKLIDLLPQVIVSAEHAADLEQHLHCLYMQVGRVLEHVGHATFLNFIKTFQGLQEFLGLRHYANSSGQLQPVRRLLHLLKKISTPLDYVLVDLYILLLATLLA